jgi:hypothetical protein
MSPAIFAQATDSASLRQMEVEEPAGAILRQKVQIPAFARYFFSS